MKWVTRARPKVDRVACPWLIKRFVDPQAEFLYVPPEQVTEVAKREGAIPFDVANVEFGHNGPECSFDAIIKKYNLTDRALQRLALDRQRGRHGRERPDARVTRPRGDCRRFSARLSRRSRIAGTGVVRLRRALCLLPANDRTKHIRQRPELVKRRNHSDEKEEEPCHTK